MSAFNSKSILKRVRIYIQLIRNTLEAKSVKSHILLGKYVCIYYQSIRSFCANYKFISCRHSVWSKIRTRSNQGVYFVSVVVLLVFTFRKITCLFETWKLDFMWCFIPLFKYWKSRTHRTELSTNW
jgi:hypothetical protein